MPFTEEPADLGPATWWGPACYWSWLSVPMCYQLSRGLLALLQMTVRPLFKPLYLTFFLAFQYLSNATPSNVLWNYWNQYPGGNDKVWCSSNKSHIFLCLLHPACLAGQHLSSLYFSLPTTYTFSVYLTTYTQMLFSLSCISSGYYKYLLSFSLLSRSIHSDVTAFFIKCVL